MMIKGIGQPRLRISLSEGLLFERRVFHAAFALNDQKEGMAAFVRCWRRRGQHKALLAARTCRELVNLQVSRWPSRSSKAVAYARSV